MDWDRINGEDIYEIRSRTWTAMERARNELRPTVLQIDTYRYYGHSVAGRQREEISDAGRN